VFLYLQSESGRSTPDHIPDMPPPPKREKEEYEYEMEIYKLSSAAPQKKENLCQICEQTGELMECQGPCQGFFHMDCLGLTVAPEGAFKCDECTNGKKCFVSLIFLSEVENNDCHLLIVIYYEVFRFWGKYLLKLLMYCRK
jgi:hypothetical protein